MTPAERKALAFLASVAALGTVARAAGLGDPRPADLPGATPSDERAALGRQLAAVDSARAQRHPRRTAGARPPRRRARAASDTTAALAPLAPLPPTLAQFTPTPPTTDTRLRYRAPPAAPAAPVDADQADSATLERLPGVGPALAHRIVADRQAHGPFGSMAGLTRVPGIGPRLEARLAPLVTFSAR